MLSSLAWGLLGRSDLVRKYQTTMTFRPQDQVQHSRWRGGKQENQRNENMANNLSGAEWWGKDGLGGGEGQISNKTNMY